MAARSAKLLHNMRLLTFLVLIFLATLCIGQVPPAAQRDSGAKDKMILTLFFDNHFRDVELFRKAEDKTDKALIADRICLRTFELWVFYHGPSKVTCDVPRAENNIRVQMKQNFPDLPKTARNWDDPRSLGGLIAKIPTGGSLADVFSGLAVVTPGLDPKAIRSAEDYKKLVSQFHQWFNDDSKKFEILDE